MGGTRAKQQPAASIQEKLSIYENGGPPQPKKPALAPIENRLHAFETLLSGAVAGASAGAVAGAAVAMVQEGEAAEAPQGGLIAPRRVPNPVLESPVHLELHRELLFNQRIGKNVLNQKSELQKALSRHKEKQIINQEKERKDKETPELERAIAERARRLEAMADCEREPTEPGTNPQYLEARARLRHAAAIDNACPP